MTTIRGIARLAGVSAAAVSMALNGKDGISETTRQRILECARELNYVPSGSAQALKTRRSHTLGLVVGNLSNPYFTDIITAAEATARESGYNIFICDAGMDTGNAIRALRALRSRGVDGILFSLAWQLGAELAAELDYLVRHGTSLVSLTPSVEHPRIQVFGFSDEAAMQALLDRLVTLGHRHIAGIGGPAGGWMNNHRLRTFHDVLVGHGLYNGNLVAYTELTIDDGREKILRLLTDHPEITALYCINDLVALGALQAARLLGKAVPEELSIVGSDGIPLVYFTTPAIATIVTPRLEIGRAGTRCLLDIIEGRLIPDGSVTTIACTCDYGASMAQARV
jgi:LacI family transcriptional regulator